jgi:LysR family hca operon transcriptional activator
MELRHLRYFVAVARELNFTRASEVVHTAQPSLSHQIKQLEDCVGAVLFYRNKHEVRLTRPGAILYRHAEEILRQVDEAKTVTQKAAEEEEQRVTVGFNPAAEIKVLPRLLEAASREPSLKFVSESHQTTEQITLLRNGRLGAAFVRAPDSMPSDIVFEMVLSENMIVVLPANHELARRRAISIDALKSVPYVTTTGPAIRRTIEDYFSATGIRFNLVRSTKNLRADLDLVSAGVGFSFVPDYVLAILPANVIARPLRQDTPRLGLMLAYRKDNRFPALQVLRRVVHDCFPLMGHA